MQSEVVVSERSDLSYALFALGAFIEHRLQDGMARDEMQPFMVSYLKLAATLEGRECHDPHGQLAQKVTALQNLPLEVRDVWPSWLPDDEKLRLHNLSKHS